jgi:broad specificity phosphatase PhoE
MFVRESRRLGIYPYKILFIRHGETDHNAQGRLQGQRDVPLNGRGREQASAVGRALLKLRPAEISRLDAAGAFVASPLMRARTTMERARTAMQLKPDEFGLDARLKEIGFGQWEGLTWPEVQARDPEAHKARHADKWNFVPPGGESYAMLSVRLRDWLSEQTGDSFIAAHGGVARALAVLLAGVDPQRAVDIDIWQGRAIAFEDGGYQWVG